MANESIGDRLREMAEHRGLKLVKSRRRKAGVGDYGKFGLTDGSGRALLGIGEDGLTASANDIEAYLRTDALGTWKQSTNVTPDAPSPKRSSQRPEKDVKEVPPLRRKGPARAPGLRQAESSKPATADEAPSNSKARQRDPELKMRHYRPVAKPSPKPAPEPELVVRPAKPADAATLAVMLSQLNGIKIDDVATRRNLEALRKAGGGVLLAELGAPIGCCCWAVVPTVHRGPVGRVGVLFVEESHRRKGIATRLLAATANALAKKGCTLVEAMSDIEIKNAHNFFRALKFEQTSYRFARKID
jgi:GNAT superfamily N-acetyltransferase